MEHDFDIRPATHKIPFQISGNPGVCWSMRDSIWTELRQRQDGSVCRRKYLQAAADFPQAVRLGKLTKHH